MNCSRAVKVAAFGLAITITIAAKVIAFNRIDPATGDNLQDTVVKLLSREGFKTQVSDRFGFVIDAQRSNCRLQFAEELIPQDLISTLTRSVCRKARVSLSYTAAS